MAEDELLIFACKTLGLECERYAAGAIGTLLVRGWANRFAELPREDETGGCLVSIFTCFVVSTHEPGFGVCFIA